MELKFRELSTDAQWGIRLSKLGVSILHSAVECYIYPVGKFNKTNISLSFGERRYIEIHILTHKF